MITLVPLRVCVFNAIGKKVESLVVNSYHKNNFMFIDEPNPFTISFNIVTSEALKYI